MNAGHFWRWLAIIVLAGALVRFPALGTVPPGMHIDENSSGYDAYSILLTGRDQYGVSYPVFFEALGNWSSGIHIYLSVPVTMLFGFGKTQTRLPYPFFGIASIIMAGCLGQVLYGSREGLLAAALVAISPWDILASRTADAQSILLTVLIPLGLCLLISGARGRPGRLKAGLVIMALSLYGYGTARFFVPLLVIGFLAIYRHQLQRNRRALALGLVCSTIVALPVYTVFLPYTANRFLQVNQIGAPVEGGLGVGPEMVDVETLSALRNVSTGDGPYATERDFMMSFTICDSIDDDLRDMCLGKLKDPGESQWTPTALERALGKWTWPLGFPLMVVGNYLTSLSPDFLFINGDPNPRHSPRGVGQLHVFEAPLLAVGLAALASGRKRRDKLLLLWLVLGPLPAAFTGEGGDHAFRLIVWLPALHLTSARGAAVLLSRRFPERHPILSSLMAVVALLGIAVFLDVYFVRYPADPYALYRWDRDVGALRIAADVVGPDGVVHVPDNTMHAAELYQAYMYNLAPHIDTPPFDILKGPLSCTFKNAGPEQLRDDVFILAPMLPWRVPPDCDPTAHGLVEVGRVSYFSGRVAGYLVYRHRDAAPAPGRR